MMRSSGTNDKILEIDLTTGEFSDIKISREERKNYLGGKGLALKLLYDRLTPGIDPLGEENIFIITTGVLIGTGAPNSARFSAVSKSPLTQIISHSSCGGPFGNALKTSGWDGIVIRGRSGSPIFLSIDSSGVKFLNAVEQWGKSTSETEKYLSNLGKGSLTIGPAGGNLVKFANIASGGRFLGRGGLGAVLGAKNIKGIVAKGGEFRIIPESPDKFKKFSSRGFRQIRNNNISSRMYNKFGTLMHVSSNNKAGILPVNNFLYTDSPKAEKISGENVKSSRNYSYHSCSNCTILCGHKGEFNGKITSVPEYETTALLGSNLGIFDIDKISGWNDLCGDLGMDTISAGGTIAYVMEAAEKGLIESPLKFGDPSHISETLENMAYLKGFGTEMAQGSRNLSEKYGGKEFCITVKGLEISGYDPRRSIGMGLNYAVANRGGCHLSSSIFGLEVTIGYLNPTSAINKADYVAFLENAIAAINSLHTCQFTIFPYILESIRLKYIPVPLLKIFLNFFPLISKQFFDFSVYSGLFSSVTGIRLSGKGFLKAGERVHFLERHMNIREGITSEDDSLPDRFIEPDDVKKGLTRKSLKKMLKQYYKIRKYNKDGSPRRSKLRSLGITAD